MAGEGEYPKTDGDIMFGKDANIAFYQELNSDTMNYGNISITTSATQILASNTSRKSLLIRNNGSAVIYIDDSGVTTSNGLELQSGKELLLYTKSAVYGITSSGTVDVRYLEVE